jgi:hypothetical protein
VIPEGRIELHAPSEWDIVLSPELAPLFVLDAAIVAAQLFFSITLDPTSSSFGGTDHPLTCDLLEVMCTLRVHIRQYRHLVALEQGLSDSMDLDQDCLSRDEPARSRSPL